MPAGTEVNIGLDRGGQKLEKKVAIADRAKVFENDPRFARNRPKMTDPEKGTETTAKFGIGIQPLTPTDRKEMNFEEQGGVRVTVVEEGSFAEEIGVREKDIIVSINRQAVASFDDVKRIQAKLKGGDPVAFRVMRGIQGARRGQIDWQGIYLAGSLPRE
jgi:serine protease Do